MAQTILTSDSEKKIYQENLYRSATNMAFWKRYHGTADSENAVVNVERRPEKECGAECEYTITPRIPPRSVQGVLDGNERALGFYYDTLKLDQHREAVIDNGRLQKIKAFFKIDGPMERFIRNWATELFDALHFKAITHDSSSANYFYQGSATSEAALTSSDLNTLDSLTELSVLASTGKSRTFEPLRPIMVDGQPKWIYLCHPDEASDLRKEAESYWQDAMPPGADNPLFRAAKLQWSDVIVIPDRRMPIKTNTGSVAISTGVLMGQQALQAIEGSPFDMVEGDKDWGNQHGYAGQFVMGVKAPEFNSKRYGSILVKSARTNISGANNEAELNYVNIPTSNQ